jgi:asparaginyl-tRNA synthetase
MLRLRSQSIAELTKFFDQREFIQTHTPIITSSDCEGAGEVFIVGDNASIRESQGRQGEGDGGFFRSTKYLTVSSQLHLEALAQAVGKVWTLSPAFRAEKSDTNRHLSEFYMLEAEVNFEDKLEGIMTLVEDMLRHLTTNIWHSKLGQEIIHGNRTGVNSVRYDTSEEAIQILGDLEPRWQGMMEKGWPRITYSDAITAMQRSSWNFNVPPTWDGGLQAEHETWLTMFIGDGKPLFVTHYPQKIKAFYMLPSHASEAANPDPGRTVDCFDLLVPQALEIAGGSMREYRLPELLSAMHTHGILPADIDASAVSNGIADEALGSMKWYVDLRRWGSVPHGGFGLGFDRLLGYLAGVPNIREVVAFPRWVGRCDC